MKENGTVIWLHTPVDVIVTRLLKEKSKRPLINTIPDHQLKTHILKKLQDRKIYYEQADIIVHENDLTLERFIQILEDV
jgi:shikimate kinase